MNSNHELKRIYSRQTLHTGKLSVSIMMHRNRVIFVKRRYVITRFIIATPLSTLLVDHSGSANLRLSHTNFGNAVVPPELSPWQEKRVREGIVADMIRPDAFP
jgi:hypothetical protein